MSPDPRRRPTAAAAGGGGGEDLSHTIHGEAVVTRHLSSSSPKAAASTSPPPRRKRPEKPRWATLLSVLTKNCLLLAALLYLSQLAWRAAPRPSPLLPSHRIADLESSLSHSAAALQTRLDALHHNLADNVAALHNTLRQIETDSHSHSVKLTNLRDRAEAIGRTATGLVTKSEFDAMLEGVKGEGDLDGIRAVARAVVEEEIGRHAADGVGRVDYAVGSGGGKVVRHSEEYGKGGSWVGAAMGRNRVAADAGKMLEPSFGEPGHCFALNGSVGFVEVRLRTSIVPEAITLEHVSKSVAYDRSSAPKDCRVSAWLEGPGQDPSNRVKNMIRLTEFSYDLEKSSAQTFNVEVADQRVVNFVRLDFTSNHGNSDLTCIYRLRVHGSQPSLAVA